MNTYYIEFNDNDGASVNAVNQTIAIWEAMYAHDIKKINRITIISKPAKNESGTHQWFVKATTSGRTISYILTGEKDVIIECLHNMHPDILISKMEIMP
jgi:hypothetical protein